MAVIMSATVGEFFAFQLPMSAVVLATIFQTLSGSLTVQSNMVAIGYCLWFIDATVNPLWTTFLSQKRREHAPVFNGKVVTMVTKKKTLNGSSLKNASNSISSTEC